jgi:hypothetical protein
LIMSQAMEGNDPLPSKAPLLQDFSVRFLGWLETTSLELKTKTYYRTGWRLLRMSAVSKMRLNCITRDDILTLRFPASESNANCALRTLRRMLNKAEEWKLIFRAPKFRLVKEHGRSLPLDAAMEAKLITAAADCNWRAKSFETVPRCRGPDVRDGNAERTRALPHPHREHRLDEQVYFHTGQQDCKRQTQGPHQ